MCYSPRLEWVYFRLDRKVRAWEWIMLMRVIAIIVSVQVCLELWRCPVTLAAQQRWVEPPMGCMPCYSHPPIK